MERLSWWLRLCLVIAIFVFVFPNGVHSVHPTDNFAKAVSFSLQETGSRPRTTSWRYQEAVIAVLFLVRLLWFVTCESFILGNIPFLLPDFG